MTIYNSRTCIVVSVCFMLSGLFLVSQQKENSAVLKRIFKIILLFYVWSAFYAFLGLAVDMFKGEFSQEVLRGLIERFSFGHIHMRFLQMLCGFCILIPIGKQICAKKKLCSIIPFYGFYLNT